MDKDDNLFEDQIDEDEDLLDISLDDLSADEIEEEPVKEEPDEDIIELIDLVERVEDDLLSFADETGALEDEISIEEANEIQDEDHEIEAIESISESDLDLDDILNEAGISVLDEDTETIESDDELDDLLSEASLDDEEILPVEDSLLPDDSINEIEEEISSEGEEVITDIPVAELESAFISEEKMEAIVTKVVGETVERVAREVFTEVAEKVITEAIDSLKESLELDSE